MTANSPPTPERLSDLPPLERITIYVWLVVKSTLPLVYMAAFVSAVLGWNAGAYAVLVWLFGYFVLNYVALGTVARAAGELDDLSQRERTWLYSGAGCLGVMLLGVCLAPTGSNAVAAMIVIGLLGHLVCHTGAAVVNYRRVMTRPWPTVAAVTDDDDYSW